MDAKMIFSSTFFPFSKSSSKKFPHKALIGVGCNVGNCVRRYKKLFLYLQSYPKVEVIASSILYKNPPFGYLEQDDFINSVMIIETSFSAKELLYFLLHTEKKFKRKRSFKNAPRTLDLDIILYDDVRYSDRKLSLPHPHFKERDSVLLPLAYL
jgi:2-amino-4-hydroxy-6-hydroxymethyldihydropteridine diphosphokinase